MTGKELKYVLKEDKSKSINEFYFEKDGSIWGYNDMKPDDLFLIFT